DAVEREPRAPARTGRWGGEAAAVQHGAVALGERLGRAPVAGNGDRMPGGVVEVALGVRAPEAVVGRSRPPAVAELDLRARRRLHGAAQATQPPGASGAQCAGGSGCRPRSAPSL